MARISQPIHLPAHVYEEWVERATALRNRLDCSAAFHAAGESYSELDENGDPGRHRP